MKHTPKLLKKKMEVNKMTKLYIKNRIGDIVAYAIVDADLSHLNKYKWFLSGNKRKQYATTTIKEKGKKKNIKLHHLIIGKSKTGLLVDHINRDQFDNRKKNLRFVTHKTNCINRKCKNILGFKGVRKMFNKYCAYININGKNKYLGSGYDARSVYEKYFVPAYISLHGVRPIEAAKEQGK